MRIILARIGPKLFTMRQKDNVSIFIPLNITVVKITAGVLRWPDGVRTAVTDNRFAWCINSLRKWGILFAMNIKAITFSIESQPMQEIITQ